MSAFPNTHPSLHPARRAPVNFGSAHLLVDRMPEATARALLEAAIAAGCSRLDTAPLYGHGGSESLVASVAVRHPGLAVTTKAGLEPSPAPSRWRRMAGTVLQGLPTPLATALRGLRQGGVESSQSASQSSRFEPGAVRRSIERSLARLGPLDRLLLHEVHLPDITDDLLELLDGYRRRGDIRALGVATGNDVTLAALQRSHGLFTVAHVSVDPLGAPWPDAAMLANVQLVGHGALGAAGRTLKRLRSRLSDDPALAARWKLATARTAFDGDDTLASVLLSYAAAVFPGELLVATTRLPRVAATVAAASGLQALPASLSSLIHGALAFETDRRPSP